MYIRGLGKLQKLWDMLHQHALILLYHRIASPETDPQLLCVSPRHFEEHLRVLSQQYYILSLQELVNRLSQGKSIHRAIVITFDDGYVDNWKSATPLLERYNAHATVFVSGGNIEQPNVFWWDQLEHIFLRPGELPPSLTVTIKGREYYWKLEEVQGYAERMYNQHREWNVLHRETPTPRHQMYRDLHMLLRPLLPEEQQVLLQELQRWAGPSGNKDKVCRVINKKELKEFALSRAIEIGAHCINHPVLSTLPENEQRQEIVGSKALLESILKTPITSFAYPYGSRADYTSATVTSVKESGFLCACSNFPDVVVRSSTPFQLPRVLVRDCSGQEFTNYLKKWFF